MWAGSHPLRPTVFDAKIETLEFQVVFKQMFGLWEI
jgi:hypothetical protein